MKYYIFNKITELLGRKVTQNTEEDSDDWKVVPTIGPFTKDGLVMIVLFLIIMLLLLCLIKFIY